MNKIAIKLFGVGLSLFAFTAVIFSCVTNENLNTDTTIKLADDGDDITSEFDKGNSREGIYVLSSNDDDITSEFDKGNSREGIYVLSSNVTNSKLVDANKTIQQI